MPDPKPGTDEVGRDAYDAKKFCELVLYIAKRSEDDPRFGAVKLNKIMYYSDFGAYRRLGQSITGANYQKLSEGPAPRQMLWERRVLLDSGHIRMESRQYFSGVQQRVVAEREPDVGVFTTEELGIVDEAIESMRYMTARQASDFSHQEPGWILTHPGETIPYQSAWLSPEPLTQEAEEYASVVASRLVNS